MRTLTMRDVHRFRDFCKPGMELRASTTRIWGFGCGDKVTFGNEPVKLVMMRIVKMYQGGALMSDGHFQRWEDLAMWNLSLV